MRLLVLGGTGFLGYHVVSEALGMGHEVSEVSAFTREGYAPLDGVEALRGARRGDLSALRGRVWDAVLDTFSDPEAVGGDGPAARGIRRGLRVRLGHKQLPTGWSPGRGRERAPSPAR